jgi:uncharacterized membrane protein HdeD (DUF308 family)
VTDATSIPIPSFPTVVETPCLNDDVKTYEGLFCRRKEFHMGNASFFDMARGHVRTGLAELNRKWGWYFALGVFLIVLGAIASGLAVATTIFSIVALGWLLLFAGAGLIVLSFLTGKWSGFLLSLATGALSAIAGLTMLSYPLAGAVTITLMIATILIAAGIYRTIASIAMRFPNWGWSLFSGLVSVALGALLLRGLQTASLWFLGLYIGIDLIIHGFSWIMFSLRVHSLAGEIGVTEEGRRAA